jgi:hypothetical protein
VSSFRSRQFGWWRSTLLYWSQSFIVFFTKVRRWTPSWATWIQCTNISYPLSFIRCSDPDNESVQVRNLLWQLVNVSFYDDGLLVPHPNPRARRPPPFSCSWLLIQRSCQVFWVVMPCNVSCTIHSQKPSISADRLLHLTFEDAPCCGDEGPMWFDVTDVRNNFLLPAL